MPNENEEEDATQRYKLHEVMIYHNTALHDILNPIKKVPTVDEKQKQQTSRTATKKRASFTSRWVCFSMSSLLGLFCFSLVWLSKVSQKGTTIDHTRKRLEIVAQS
jgi:hypothetical protein